MRSRSTDVWTASAEFSRHNPPLNDSTDATQRADSDGTSGCVTEFASELRPKQGKDSHHCEYRSSQQDSRARQLTTQESSQLPGISQNIPAIFAAAWRVRTSRGGTQ